MHLLYCSRVRKLALAPLASFALLALASLPGCKSCASSSDRGSSPDHDRPRVAVSIFPIYDLVRRVAGPDADVTLLLQPGKNEHTFDPTPKDIENAAKSKLGVMVGLGLDPWMEKLMKEGAPKARLLTVGDRVPALTIKDDPVGAEDPANDPDHDHEGKGALDPHVWMDPERAQLIVHAVAEELGKVDGAHTVAYRERATALAASLNALDQEAEKRLRAMPRKGFVTFHGSFGYFAERYKLSIIAVIEPFPGSEPTGEYIAKVLKVIKDKNVPALFSEPQLNPRPAKVLADEAKIPLGVLDPIGGSNPDTDSYEKMIRYDVAQLEKYLGTDGAAP
jgi:zinc transport system substrate-binding protein